jgi:hypothetical protein
MRNDLMAWFRRIHGAWESTDGFEHKDQITKIQWEGRFV